MKPTIFVTGATGLVGYHAVQYLSKQGYAVVAAVRASSNQAQLQSIKDGSVNVAIVDLDNADELTGAITGCQAVVHCAGSVDMQASRESIMATNVGATINALKAAKAAGVKHFVHISSLSVITGQHDQYNVDESAPLVYSGENYADSKVEAEKAVRAHAGTMPFTILRPGFIYGPGERAWMPRLIANIRSGKAMLVDGGVRATNVIYVENLARAIALSLFNEKAYGQAYNLTDTQTPTKKVLFDTIADGLHLPRITKSMPRAVVQAACGVVALISPMLSKEARQNLARFSPGAYRLAAVNQGFSIAKAQRELAYTDLIPFKQGMMETLKTFVEQRDQSKEKVGCNL
ncbi:MAG TPA: NAD-dependent epimerase/dehydratase family protein [Candidatus Obscuribacterales bacterium]